MKTLKHATLVFFSLVALLISFYSLGQDSVDLEDEDERIAYSLGANIGQNLVAQELIEGIDVQIFVAGMLDAFSDDLKLQPAEMMAAIQTYMERQADADQLALSENLTMSAEFLEQNSQNDGVVTLDSGLQYLVLESGPEGGASPTPSDSVLAHYHGTLIDGNVFDSSVDRGEPASFGVSQVISGWTEALQLMKTGDKWRLFIPPDMAYGESSPTPAIPPNSALIFDVELLEVR
ncbi:MAG: FKBP-type peptidyl-prolyl cis-trans isomerase [Pseudomonadota bacterium]|nr:FKBP-type peptidyl-prolyl cis-trans isomerase [Pseudomonadales bacterium]MEC7766720.1 FKBP-type peptidyl-prolyl cis-trans isomerase [Pseudomonadota bacterium]HAI15329.1 peptidylprolyl isomerase [Gammaproteobacteria bacterium]MEC9218621.1 FKBP-type peptidyl-prolyl cis-trans isomerase [Pseudomonadota bacterium]MEC9299604.1 FKBP-type peptidyl-prolyl cis-trans isomerase [Pseudomonadota bacterium]|tara:strand:+ start:3586 stop:4287 length:702 start_codon:yes stop_codon:yes gene_type:complete